MGTCIHLASRWNILVHYISCRNEKGEPAVSKKLEKTRTYEKVGEFFECLQMQDKNAALHKIIEIAGRYRLWTSYQNEVIADRCADIICPPVRQENEE
jgi:hypothetical protein